MATIINKTPKITTCLWFDNNAEQAVDFYMSVFKEVEVLQLSRYGKNAPLPEGTVLTIVFKIFDQQFMALNGGPIFTFSEAISFVVNCDSQTEIDYYWNCLSEGGQTSQCGWLKDRFGLSWQIVPVELGEMMQNHNTQKSQRVMQALLKMEKLDLEKLRSAFNES